MFKPPALKASILYCYLIAQDSRKQVTVLKPYIKRQVNLFICILLHTFLPIPKGSKGRSGVSSTSVWYTGRSRFKSRSGDRLFCSHIHAFCQSLLDSISN